MNWRTVGPWDGWRRQANAFTPRVAVNAWTRPMVVVLLPSPNGVGVILKVRDNSSQHVFIDRIHARKHCSPSNDDIFSVAFVLQSIERFQRDFRLLRSVEIYFVRNETDFFGQFGDIFRFLRTGDNDVAANVFSELLNISMTIESNYHP